VFTSRKQPPLKLAAPRSQLDLPLNGAGTQNLDSAPRERTAQIAGYLVTK
jgi:hypothetical protein